MLNVSLKINPFTNEVSVQKDGKAVKPTNRLSGFYKSFINTALNLKEIILEDENIDSFLVTLESSMFERMFLEALAAGGSGNFQVQRKDFLIAVPIEKRIQTLFSFRKMYPADVHPVPPQMINIYASQAADAEALVGFLNDKYPWLRDIGITLAVSPRVVDTQINFFSNHAEVAANAKFLPALAHDISPLVFCGDFSLRNIDNEEAVAEAEAEMEIRQENSVSVDHGVVIWDLELPSAKITMQSFFERYFIYPQIDKIISNFHPAINTAEKFDEYVEFQLLNKVFETVIVRIPEELEKGAVVNIPIKTFFGEKQPEFKISSNYRDIIDAECSGETITLKALEVGDSDIKLEATGILTPIATSNIKVVDYGYATDVRIVLEDNPEAERFITTPGSRVKLGLKYEPQTVKAAEDAKNATWLVSDEKCGFFDKENMMFHAQVAGNVKVLAKLARKQADFPIIIKPNVVDYTLSLINETDDHVGEIRKGGEDQSVEYVRCYIATLLRFKLERHPGNAINSPIAIEFTDGISIEKNAEEDGFVVNARRVGKGELIKVSLPGCNVVKSIMIDIVPNLGNLNKDNRAATLIIVSLLTTLLLIAGSIFLVPMNIYFLTIGVLVLAFDGYAIYRSAKSIRYLLILFTIMSVAAIGYSVCRKYIPGVNIYAKHHASSTGLTSPVESTNSGSSGMQTMVSDAESQTSISQSAENQRIVVPNPEKQKNLTGEMESFAEENCPEEFEAYSKAKRSIRNKKIILNKAKSDGAAPARLAQLQRELNESIVKFNTVRQQIINAYNSKNTGKEIEK